MKRMAAVRHGAEGITTKNNPSETAGWRAGWSQLELVGGSFSFNACAFWFFAFLFFLLPFPPPSWWRGKGQESPAVFWCQKH